MIWDQGKCTTHQEWIDEYIHVEVSKYNPCFLIFSEKLPPQYLGNKFNSPDNIHNLHLFVIEANNMLEYVSKHTW
jgi:hypothetical protein